MIEYENGTMIVTHDSGRVDTYTADDLQEFCDSQINKRIQLDADISFIQRVINFITDSA